MDLIVRGGEVGMSAADFVWATIFGGRRILVSDNLWWATDFI